MEEKLIPGIIDISKTGSTVICDPAPTDTDEDWIVLTDDINKLKKELLKHDFKPDCGKEYEDPEFVSFSRYTSKGVFSLEGKRTNYIVTESNRFFKSFVFATEIAKRLNITEKRDRIDFFTIVRKYYEIN